MYNSEWYQGLTRPPLSPEAWVFPPVWTILYITIFASLLLYFLKKEPNKGSGYIFFTLQLLLNFSWSFVFFSARNIGFALFVIILMDIFIFLTVKKFYQVSKPSGIILIPYQLWVLFATYLNAGYYILNS